MRCTFACSGFAVGPGRIVLYSTALAVVKGRPGEFQFSRDLGFRLPYVKYAGFADSPCPSHYDGFRLTKPGGVLAASDTKDLSLFQPCFLELVTMAAPLDDENGDDPRAQQHNGCGFRNLRYAVSHHVKRAGFRRSCSQ